MPVDPPFTVYRDQLSALSHGFALWNPNPPKKIYDNVSIGDVGYLFEGTFIRMFNVTLPWDHPSNGLLGTPELYDPMDCGPFVNTIEAHFDGPIEHYSRFVTVETNANDMEGVTYRFRSRGALLSLPNGGRRLDVIRTKRFEDYIRDHVHRWFNWAQNNRLGVERMEDLILVTGCTMVTSWAAAAFVDNNSEAEISLTSKTVSNVGASFVWGNVRGRVSYHNSRFDPQNPPTMADQCVFIRGLQSKHGISLLRIGIRLFRIGSKLLRTGSGKDDENSQRSPYRRNNGIHNTLSFLDDDSHGGSNVQASSSSLDTIGPRTINHENLQHSPYRHPSSYLGRVINNGFHNASSILSPIGGSSINHENPYPSSTVLHSNGDLCNASFTTSPSDGSFIEDIAAV